MRKSAQFLDQFRAILERSFDSLRGEVYRPTVTELNELEAELVSEFTDDVSKGVGEAEVRKFAARLKALHGTRIAMEEQLARVQDALRRQLRPVKD